LKHGELEFKKKIKQALKYYPEIELVLQEVGHAFQIQFRKKIADRTSTGQVPDKYRTSTGQVPDKNRTRCGQGKTSQILP